MEEPKNKSEKKESLKKWKILGSKSSENYLFNVISFLLNNKDEFDEKLKFTDLVIKFTTDSEISSIDKLKYKITLNNNSFNPKRDINQNIKKYSNFPSNIEINDEYYSRKKIFKEINIELIPALTKHMQLDMSLFPFYHYDNNKKKIERCNLQLQTKTNKFFLFIYFTQFNDVIMKTLGDFKFIDNFFDYFENIYLICESKTVEEMTKKLKDEKLSKYFINKDNNNEEKIKFIFNILSNYNSGDNAQKIMNIFKDEKNLSSEYFFLLNQDNKIISLEKDLNHLIAKISIFIMTLKRLDKENKTYKDLLKIKENKKKEKYLLLKELMNFITNINKFNYLFDFEFEISFSASLNEECTEIIFEKLNLLDIKGQFRTKDCQYLENLLSLLKCKSKKENIKYNLTEMPTLDIDIDFTDMKCIKCSKIIPEDKHLYYCYICRTKYCYECVHEQLKKTGKEKYLDLKHNLIFFKTRNKNDFKNIDKERFGKNKFSQCINDDEDFSNGHDAICNGCRGHFNGMARYVCMHCRPGIYLSGGYIDYCQRCIEKMCSDDEQKKELEENASEQICFRRTNFTAGHTLLNKHIHDQHIYLLLPLQFNSNSYKEY